MGFISNFLGGTEEKSVPAISSLNEMTRDGLPKAYIPKFLYKPPFGYPRYVDLPNVRRLASIPAVEMCTTTIVDEISGLDWNIVLDEGFEMTDQKQAEVDHVQAFFDNPNTNNESWENIIRKVVRDIAEIDSGVINKIFNQSGQMVEMVARDGATFTKNPDIYGMFTDRDDLIIETWMVPGAVSNQMQANHRRGSTEIFTNREARLMEPGFISYQDARERAAYFQYGWITGARPVPFGKREIVWMERNPRTDDLYGRSPVEILADVLQTLIYAVEHNLEYFNDNSIPKGIIGLDGSNTEEIKAFRDQWKEAQRKKDDVGNWKKDFHNVPIVNKMPKFERIQFSNAELELIQQQEWFFKMVWACYGITPSELGYTEASNKATEIIQSQVFRRKAINPIVRLLEYKINHEIINEFSIGAETKIANEKKAQLKAQGKEDFEAEAGAKEAIGEMRKNKTLPYQGIIFKYDLFDTEEERKKAELYALQTSSGMMTVNEIRKEMGKDPVNWGDDAPAKWGMPEQSSNISFGDYPKEQGKEKIAEKAEQGAQAMLQGIDVEKEHSRTLQFIRSYLSNFGVMPTSEQIYAHIAQDHLREDPKYYEKLARMEQKEFGDIEPVWSEDKIESKPFAGYSNFDDCVSKNRDKQDPKAYCATIMRQVEGKGDGEEFTRPTTDEMNSSQKELKKRLIAMMKEKEKKVMELMEKEAGKPKLQEIKAFDEFFKFIKDMFKLEGVRELVNDAIRTDFLSGWEGAEKEMGRNFMVNKEAIRFIQDYTYDKVKGMTEEISNDLRGELERGMMQGEGITKIKERVRGVFDKGETRSEAIARTETNRADNYGRMLAFQESKEPYVKKWIAHKDDRTSELCKRLDGQIVPLDGKFRDKQTGWEGPCPPGHVNCRSTFVIIPKE